MATSDTSGWTTVNTNPTTATVGTATSSNTWWTPQPGVASPIMTAPLEPPNIHLDGKDAHINFDGVSLTKEDVELLHLLLAKLKGKLAQKRASEKDLTDAISDAVKELGG